MCWSYCRMTSYSDLQMYTDVLDTLEHGPLKNMVSPPIMASSGVIPISVISL